MTTLSKDAAAAIAAKLLEINQATAVIVDLLGEHVAENQDVVAGVIEINMVITTVSLALAVRHSMIPPHEAFAAEASLNTTGEGLRAFFLGENRDDD